jgi:hypothetical protein
MDKPRPAASAVPPNKQDLRRIRIPFDRTDLVVDRTVSFRQNGHKRLRSKRSQIVEAVADLRHSRGFVRTFSAVSGKIGDAQEYAGEEKILFNVATGGGAHRLMN